MILNKDFTYFPKWQRVISTYNPNLAPTKYTKDTVRKVNSFINTTFRYIPEDKDIWKIPEEFDKDGGGDCEDFAIAKYFMLTEYAYPEQYMYIVVGRLKSGIIHAMLEIREKNNKKIWLDNINTNVIEYNEKYFKPIYYINRNGWEMAVQK